jgi:hypothetical protein
MLNSYVDGSPALRVIKPGMSVGNPNTRHRGIPRLCLEIDSCRLELILEGRSNNVWKVDCHESNILS